MKRLIISWIDDVARHPTVLAVGGVVVRLRMGRDDRIGRVSAIVVVDVILIEILAVDVGVGTTDQERIRIPVFAVLELRCGG
ncbi:hypothetical protein [Halalkalicoccus ordinarius]|uniref:hypothetical protein n=1 Tax=Halalkalicoccus ordinarius TaxID=3116651 RepID=UPI00300F53FF